MVSKRRRQLYLFGLASFFNDAGSDMIAVLTPLWLRQLGAEHLIPLASAIREGVPLLFNFLSAKLSSLWGKLAVTRLGYALSSLSKWVLAFSSSPATFLAALTGDRIGKGIRDPARDAILASLYRERRTKAFSLHQALDTLGSLTGGLLLLLLAFLPLPTLFLLAAFLASLSLLPLAFVRVKDGLSLPSAPVYWKALLLGLPVFGITIPLSLSEGLAEGAFFFILFNGAYVLSAYLSQRLSSPLPIAYLLVGLSAFLFPFLPMAAFPLFGAALGLFKVGSLSLIADRTGGHVKGMGPSEALLGLSLILSNAAFGPLSTFGEPYFLYGGLAFLYALAYRYLF